MSSAVPSHVPGQSPPLFTVTPNDKAGDIVIVAALCISIAGVSMLVRAWVRFGISSQDVAWDDGVVGAALGFCILQGVLVFDEIHHGLGKTISHLTAQQIHNIQTVQYANDMFYIVTLWLSKVGTSFLLLRLSPKVDHRRMNFAAMGLLALTGIASIFVIALRCDLSHPWIWFNLGGSTCTNFVPRWVAIAVLDIFTEVALVVASIYLVWSLQMAFSNKVAVVFAFATRLLVIIPIAFRLRYLSRGLESKNPTLNITPLVIITQVQIACAIVVASVPTLRPFMLAAATHYGAPAEGATTRSGNHQSISLKNLSSKLRKSKAGSASNNNTLNQSRDHYGNEEHGLNTNGTGDVQRDGTSARSGDSREMIIRKDVQYQVEYGQ